jgi:hypothetical protein
MESSQLKSKKYCIAVDGSDYSDWAFQLVTEELYSKGDKIVLVHISNSSKLSEIPFAFQPKTILSKYDAKLAGKLSSSDYKIITQDRDSTSSHALLQVNNIAIKENCSVLVLGFHGHNMSKDKKEISKGISFIISNIKLPTIVVKENVKRKNKSTGIFTWATCIEEANSRSFKAFEYFSNYLNITKDKMIGSHIDSHGSSTAQEVKELFLQTCQTKGISNYEFEITTYSQKNEIGTIITNFVNFNEKDQIDFLIVGHNPKKNSEKSPLNMVIKSAQCNVLFYS